MPFQPTTIMLNARCFVRVCVCLHWFFFALSSPTVTQYYHIRFKTRLFQKFFLLRSFVALLCSSSQYILYILKKFFPDSSLRFLELSTFIILKKFFSARSSLRRILSVGTVRWLCGDYRPYLQTMCFYRSFLPFNKKTQSLPSSRLCGLILLS